MNRIIAQTTQALQGMKSEAQILSCYLFLYWFVHYLWSFTTVYNKYSLVLRCAVPYILYSLPLLSTTPVLAFQAKFTSLLHASSPVLAGIMLEIYIFSPVRRWLPLNYTEFCFLMHDSMKGFSSLLKCGEMPLDLGLLGKIATRWC